MSVRNKLIILKLGGSVITHKSSGRKMVNRKNLERLSLELSRAQKKEKFSIIIIHGVGSFGHIIAGKFKLNDGFKNKKQVKVIPLLRGDLEKLNTKVIKTLMENKLNTMAVHPSSLWTLNNRRLKNANLDMIKNLLKLELTPVLYGDILTDSKLGFSILSGDQIVYYLAKKLNAVKVIVGTDVDGVFDANPKINKGAKLIKEINKHNVKQFCVNASTAVDVTGGMGGKINELLKLANFGIESEIINISKQGILEKSLRGKKGIGTLIVPA